MSQYSGSYLTVSRWAPGGLAAEVPVVASAYSLVTAPAIAL